MTKYDRWYEKANTISVRSIWDQLNHFGMNENWGRFGFMDVRLLHNLDAIRDELHRGININCAYESSGHSSKSTHYLGMAADFYVTDTCPQELYTLYCFFLDNWYGGVGVYPYWNKPGFHLDIGPNYRTWTRDKNGIYLYDSKEIKDTVDEFALAA